MKRRSIVALCLAAVAAATVAATTSGATQKATASSITVWLQADAQSGWSDLVAAASQKFQADHPGTTVNIQYQSWGDHLQKFDATLAGGGGPDVIEMGNSEMTKYMAAGAFASLDKSIFDNSGGLDRVIYIPTRANSVGGPNATAGVTSLWLGAKGERPSNTTITGSV